MVCPEEGPVAAALGALILVARAERPGADLRALTLVEGTPWSALVGELGEGPPRMRISGARREIPLPAPLEGPSAPPLLPASPVAVVSGGGRGAGAEVAGWLARRAPGARIALINRGERPEHVALERRLRAAGAEVLRLSADVADAAALATALDQVRATFGPPNLLIHAAGLGEDRPLARVDAAHLRRIYAPKLRGLLNLRALTAGIRWR